MKDAGQGVDHQLDVVTGQHMAVVGVRVAAQLLLGALTPVLEDVGDGDDAVLAGRALEPARVDVEAAATLTEDAHPDGPSGLAGAGGSFRALAAGHVGYS